MNREELKELTLDELSREHIGAEALGVDGATTDAYIEKLRGGYVPSPNELLRLDAVPELALQARVILNSTFRKKYEEDPCYGNLAAYTDSLYELADYLMMFELWEDALRMLDVCIDILREKTENDRDEHLLTTLYIAHDRMGDIAAQSGDFNEAFRQFMIVHDLIKEIAGTDPEMASNDDCSIIKEKLAYASEMAGREEEALRWYQEAFELREKNAKPEDAESMRRYFEAMKNLGSILMKTDDYPKARKLLEKAADGAEKLYAGTKATDELEIVINALDKLGIMAKDEERYRDSAEIYKKCISVLDILMKDHGNDEPDWRRSLSRSCQKLADAYILEGTLPEAEEWLKKSIRLSERLVKEDKDPEDIRDLISGHDKYGDVRGVAGQAADAITEYEKAFRLTKRLRGPKDEALQNTIFFILKKLSIISRTLGRTTDAMTWGEKALRAARTLEHDDPSEENRRFLANCLTDLGEIEEDLEHWSGARDWYTKALKINSALYRENPSVENKSEYSDNHDGLGFVAISMNDLKAAEEHFNICLTLNEELLHSTGLIDEKRALAVTCRQLGLIAAARNDLSLAKRHLNRSLDLQKAVMKESQDDEDRLTYGDIYEDLVGLPCETIKLPMMSK